MSVILDTLSLANLASLYNLLAEKPVTKFKDKATGVARLVKILDETKHEVFEVDGEYDVRPEFREVAMEKPVAAMVPQQGAYKIATDEDIHAASNKLIGDAIANSPELAAMVVVKDGKKRGRKSGLTGKKVTLVREKNPKRPGSKTAVRYEVYREAECKTSDDYIRLCEERGLGTRREILSDLDYDSKQEFIKLS